MKRLFPFCALAALISCCALTALVHSTPAAQSATYDLSAFGAVGDGVTDDGPAIKRALDALADAGGGTLTVPAGRFAIRTPVLKDFRGGKAAGVTIRGVASGIDPNPKGSGAQMTTGLGLVSEFVVQTGPDLDALSVIGLDTFLISDIVFIGTPEAETDARVSLGLFFIRDAVVRRCEFYGLSTLSPGGAILHSHGSSLTLEKSVFLGSTGSSAHRIPVVQNQLWKGFVMTETIFADYGQRPGFYGKLTVAPLSWVMLGNPAPVDNLSPRREASMRNVFFDEGGFIGVASFPDYYDSSSKPPDLVHISDFRMNVSSLNSSGIYIYRGARNLIIERGEFMLARYASSAVELANAGDVILDQLVCGAAADTIRADAATRRLTVINSTYNHLESQAQFTQVISSTDPDKDPVQYVRQRFLSALAREADPAASYFWSDLILRCNDVASCVTARRDELTTYLAASPQPSFSLSGRATKDNGSGLTGVTVSLSGSQAVAATVNASGDYTFAGLPTSGDYTLTPGRINYTFTPASHAVSRPAGDRTVNLAGKANRLRIAGRVVTAGGAPVAGATVALSGTETGTATTDSNGNYSLGVGAEGSYTVTPTRANYTFTPASRSFTNVVADQAADFTGTPVNYTISGRVTEGTAGLAGVTVTLSGSMAGTRTTDAAGNYSFTVVAEGNYTVTAARTNYTFTPASATFNSLPGNRTANFAATLNRHAIRGKVTNAAGNPVAGVAVALSGSQAGSATTDSTGNYTFSNLPAGGSYTVTPTRVNYTFTPASRSFTNVVADQTADFTGALVSYTISGRVTAGGVSLAGATVALSGSKAGTATSDANGAYTFTVTAEGNYTVTASRTNYTFAPTSAVFNNLSANAVADFAGTLVSYKITGSVTKGGAALNGVSVTLSGSSAGTATTGADGLYSFTVKAEGNYTVTPALAHHDMTPPSRAFNSLQSDQSGNFVASTVNYTISGRVTAGGNALAGVAVTLSGSQSGTTTTDADGRYSFAAQARGNYTVTPARANYTFTPQSQTFNDLIANRAADFQGTLKNYTISGRVTSNGAGMGGATVTLSGSQTAQTTTAANGAYTFTVAAEGNYTVTAARPNYTFAPPGATFNKVSADSSADFAGTLASYQISGRVTEDGGAAIAGVSVTLSGSAAGTATTGADGTYSFTVAAEGDYKLTAAHALYNLAPAARTFDSLSGPQAVDFAGELKTYAVGGRVLDANNAGVVGATVTLSGSAVGTAITDASGAFSFAGLTVGGDYTVTPSGRHAFAPAGRSYRALAASVADADFSTTTDGENVTWANLTGAEAVGATLTRGAAPAGWTAGASSTRAIASGEGYVEFTAAETNTNRMAGLSNGDSDRGFADIDYAWFLYADGSAYVFEGGVNRGAFGPYAVGDRFRVSVEGGVVRYRRNGELLYTSTVAPQYPLLVDTSLSMPGSAVTDATLSGLLINVTPGEAVVWGSVAGVTAAGNSLRKSAASYAWDAGASSTKSLASGDGHVEFTATETSTNRLCGLSRGDTDQDYADVDYAWFLYADGSAYVFEGAVNRGLLATYSSGDRFRVSVEGGAVKYWKNGVLLYTSAVAPQYPLLVDTSLSIPGATVNNVVISGDWVENLLATPPQAVTWARVVGAAASGGSLTRGSAPAGWTAGASSTKAIASGDGYVEFTAAETNTNRMAGLSNGDTDQGYADIDYAVYLYADGSVYVFEGGVNRGAFGRYAVGDRFRVSVEGGTVKYWKNGVLLYTSTVAPQYPLLLDASLSIPGATITDATISGSLTP